jgi:hypothetical protein
METKFNELASKLSKAEKDRQMLDIGTKLKELSKSMLEVANYSEAIQLSLKSYDFIIPVKGENSEIAAEIRGYVRLNISNLF